MKLERGFEEHLTYCTNVHPGETLADVVQQLERDVVLVKQAVAPNRDFGVGLRLSAPAAYELASDRELTAMKQRLARLGLYVFTINGFPYGQFHETSVKERVYQPDWLEDERLRYTNHLARILSALLPTDGKLSGSISTVPGSSRKRAQSASARQAIARRMLLHVEELARIESETGHHIRLALEPEPGCLLETTAEAIAFIERELRGQGACAFLARQMGIAEGSAEALVRRHVGVCFDTCHAAVEFEDPAASLQALGRAEIAVAKLQLSSGLSLRPADPAAIAELELFDDGVYLHQVVAQTENRLVRFLDLPEAFAARAQGGDSSTADGEWRVHFHVPIFLDRLKVFHSTQAFLEQVLTVQRVAPFTQHLEVETYTWGVLPQVYRQPTVHGDLARELEWAKGRLLA